jgi:hypothetical protein
MPLFICRWPNGDFSAVSAASRDEAVELLDEAGNADSAEIFTMKNFMVHFRLKEQVTSAGDGMPVELEEFGEETMNVVWDRVYPVFDKAFGSVFADPSDSDEARDASIKTLNEALITERMRDWEKGKLTVSEDPSVAELQKFADMPKKMAEKIVNEDRERAIIKTPRNTDKVQ